MTGYGQDRMTWARRPLCRRYVLGVFDAAAVRWREAGGQSAHRVHWAFGWLADGECEPLGVWIERAPDGVFLMLADLQARGVERIWRVAGTESWQIDERTAPALLGKRMRLSADQLAPDASAASPQHEMVSAQLVVDQVREGLIRALRRRGSFDGEADAFGFVAGVLQRAERRLDRERLLAKGLLRLDAGVQIVTPGA